MDKQKLEIYDLSSLIDAYEDFESEDEDADELLYGRKYVLDKDIKERIKYLTDLILSHKPAESKSEYLRFIKDSFEEVLKEKD